MLVQGFIEIRKKNAIPLGLIEELKLAQLNREWELNKGNLIKYCQMIDNLKLIRQRDINNKLITWILDNVDFDKIDLTVSDVNPHTSYSWYKDNSLNEKCTKDAREIFDIMIRQNKEYWNYGRLENGYYTVSKLSSIIQNTAGYKDYYNQLYKDNIEPNMYDSRYRPLLTTVSIEYWKLLDLIKANYKHYNIKSWLNKSSITSEPAKYF